MNERLVFIELKSSGRRHRHHAGGPDKRKSSSRSTEKIQNLAETFSFWARYRKRFLPCSTPSRLELGGDERMILRAGYRYCHEGDSSQCETRATQFRSICCRCTVGEQVKRIAFNFSSNFLEMRPWLSGPWVFF